MIHRFISCAFLCTLSIHNINADSFQAKHIATSHNSNFITSIQKELRSLEYQKEILPNDFSYCSDLIAFGVTNNQPPAYLRSVITLFSKMLKKAHYTNAYAFSSFLEPLPLLLQPYFEFSLSRKYITDSALYDSSFVDRFNSTVHAALYSKFSSEYESFRQNPDQFLCDMSANIVTLAQEEITHEQLRQDVIKFCEIALGKLIWNPADQLKTWEITKKIAEQLAVLLEKNIIYDSNDLDDLYETLLNRYCYFIEVTATDLSESFYTTVKHDITNRKILLFESPEQDLIIESKLLCMQRTIIEAESRAYFHRGLARK